MIRRDGNGDEKKVRQDDRRGEVMEETCVWVLKGLTALN